MNHLKALKAFEKQSKQANAEAKKIIATNMNWFARGLHRQTKNELSAFQKSLKLTLKNAQVEHKNSIFIISMLTLIPVVIGCLILIGTGIWATQKVNTLTRTATLSTYPTQPYQGKNYTIVPKANVMTDDNGNYWIKIK